MVTGVQSDGSVLQVVSESAAVVALALGLSIWSHRVLYQYFSSSSPSIKSSCSHELKSSYDKYLHLLFDVTVGSSVLVIELVLCEICSWLSHNTRLVLWSSSTGVLLSMLALVIPFAEIAIATRSIVNPKHRWPIIVTSFLAYLYAFYWFGQYIQLSVEPAATATTTSKLLKPAAQQTYGWMEFCLSRIGFIGVTSMAILAGFSAVSAPYEVFISKARAITQNDIDRLQRSVAATSDLLQNKKHSLQRIGFEMKDRKSMSTTNLIMMKVISSITGGDSASQEYASVNTEISTLQKMLLDLENDLETARSRFKYQKLSKTIFGRLHKKFYFVFAVYCIYRLFSVLILKNPLSPLARRRRNSESDALVISLAHILQWWYPTSDIDAVATQISFALSGLLFIASISSVLTTLKTLSKGFPALKTATNATSGMQATSIVVAQLLGTYVISTSLLLRSNLPANVSSAITAALRAPLDIPVVDRLSDSTFCIVALATMFALWMVNRWHQDDCDDPVSDAFYDEESLIEGKLD